MGLSTRSRASVIGGLVLVALVVALTLLSSKPSGTAGASSGASASSPIALGSPRATPTPTATARATPAPPASILWHTTEVGTQLSAMAATPRGLLAIGWDARGGVLWRSKDGGDWAIDDQSVVFDSTQPMHLAANQDRTVIVGCLANAYGCVTPVAWTRDNTDTGTWTRSAAKPFGGVQPTTVIATSTGFLAAGQDLDAHWLPWISSDGLHWTAATSPASGDDQLWQFVGLGDVYAAVGKHVTGPGPDGNGAGPAVLWTSTDGHTWSMTALAENGAAWAATSLPDGGAIIVGGSNDQSYAEAWTSSDRSHWTTIVMTPEQCGSVLSDVVTGPDGILARGPCGSVDLTPGRNPVAVGDSSPQVIVDGGRGYVGIGPDGHSIVTSFFQAVNVPLDPLAGFENGQGWSAPTSLPVTNPMTAAMDRKGRILVFSPVGSAGSFRLDRFDPVAKKWARLQVIPAGMSWAKAVVEHSGRILVVGVSLSGRYARAFELDATSLTWRWRASPRVARTNVGLAELDGFVYTVGGRVSPCCDGVAGDGALDVMERYDEAHDSWRTVGHLPVPDLAPGAIGAQVPVPPDPAATPTPTPSDGSEVPPPTKSDLLVFLPTRVWLYDPATGAWTPGDASLSNGVTGSPVLGIDGLIRVFTCTRYDLYDPSVGHWQPGQSFEVDRCGAIAVTDGTTVYVFGGTYLPDPGRSVSAFFSGGG